MNLYKVDIEKTVMVLAENEADAESTANRHSGDEEADQVSISKVTSVKEVPLEWLNGIPYGGADNDNRSCKQIAEAVVDPTIRTPSRVAWAIKEVVPEKEKSSLHLFAEAYKYTAPEQWRPLWGVLGGIVSAMVPSPPIKMKEEWQVKAVALLMNKSEEFVWEHFGIKE